MNAADDDGELPTNEYLLGCAPEELHRLGFQHRVWSHATHALWNRAGFGPGQRLVDLGCGPSAAGVA